MIEVELPERLSGEVLRGELAAAGVEVSEDAMTVRQGRLHVDAPDSDEATVREVVDAHDPPEPVDRDEAFRHAVERASSVADLKAALLGGNGSPGAEPRRGRSDH